MTWSFVAATVLLGTFLAVERRVRQPVVPLDLFAVRNRAIAFIGMLLVPAAMFGVFCFDTQYFQLVRDYSPLRTGLAFLSLAVGTFASSMLAARALARHGLRRTAGGGLVLAAAGILLQSMLSTDSGYWTALFGPLLINGLGLGFVFMPLSVLILTGVTPDRAGAASGLMQTMQQVGGALGLSALVTVYGAAVRAADLPGPDGMVEGYATGLLAGAGFPALTLILLLATRTADASPAGE
ncbi:MFS transporter [Streptomyces sp. NPDC059153]|uniref:MFS transporter n=1 Tax=Streptomyces sp. NPDC059153 TaxID=3346743 RepID=UPI003688AFF8